MDGGHLLEIKKKSLGDIHLIAIDLLKILNNIFHIKGAKERVKCEIYTKDHQICLLSGRK